MTTFFLKRIFVLIVTLLLVSMTIFAVLMVIPGDPAQIILGIHATPETLQGLRHKLGLDRPVTVQYLRYMKNLAVGDLGRSITYDVPIGSLILSTAPGDRSPGHSVDDLCHSAISIPMGIYSALHRNQAGDYGIMVFSQIGLAVPAFWAGILLILLFAVTLHWFPAGGFPSWGERSGKGPEVSSSSRPLPRDRQGCGAYPDDPLLHARNLRGGLYPDGPKQRTIGKKGDL